MRRVVTDVPLWRRKRILALAVAGGLACATARHAGAATSTSFVPFVTDSTHMAAANLAAAANVPGSAGAVYDASGNTNDISIVNFGSTVYTGAFNVATTIQRIALDDSVHNNESDDGGFFNFNSGELPNIPRMGANYYMEFMVWPLMDLSAGTYDKSSKLYGSVSFPGPIRILLGSAGEVYFTGDHYATNDYVNPTAPPTEPTLITWKGSTGNWTTTSNWDSSTVPAANQAAYLTSSDTASRTVTYNYTGPGITLADVLVNSDGTSTANGSMTLNQSANALATQKEEVWARYATAAVNQSGGVALVYGTLQVGEFVGSSGSYTLSGSAFLSTGSEYIGDSSLAAGAGSGTFVQTGGTHSFSGSMSIGCATVGGGSYSLSAGTLSGGLLSLNAGGTFTQTGGTLSIANLAINSGGMFTNSGGSETINSLQLSGSGKMVLSPGGNRITKVQTISIGGTSWLDIGNNKLIITSASSMLNDTNLIKSGRNGGSWNGSGIITSMTAAQGTNALTTIALATAGSVGKTSFGGVSVASTDILLMYTYTGDANMDGKINADDYFLIDENYSKHLSSPTWVNGDFNYDGKINGDDYELIDAAFAGQGAVLSGAQVVGDLGAVPEPASVGFLLLTGSLLIRRQAKRKINA